MAELQQDLEGLVVQIQKAGQEWIEAKLKSDQLSDGEKNYLARLMNTIEHQFKNDKKLSEHKIERLARGSEDFEKYVVGKVFALAETGRKRVRYEALMNLWEAKRSQLAFERAKVEKGLFDKGIG